MPSPLENFQDQQPETALQPAAASATPIEKPSARSMSRAHLPASVSLIMSLALPTLIEQLFSAAIGFTDTIIAGHTGNSEAEHAAAIGAVGAMTYLQWFAGLTAAALGIGATAIVARAIGAHRPRMAHRTAGTACAAAFLIGIAVALIFFFAAPLFVKLFSLHGVAGEMGVAYLRIMAWTLCFQTAGLIGMACLRGAGDTFRPMVVVAGCSVVNGFFSWALTFGKCGLPAWGVRGNATGTLLAFAVQGVVTFLFLTSGDAGLTLRLRHFRIIPHILARVARIALPSWAENALLWGGQTAIVLLVMGQVDATVGMSGATLGAHTAVLRIESLAFLPGFGFGSACAALVGQYLGAKKPDQAQRATVLCNRLALLTMSTAALLMVIYPLPRLLLSLVVDSPTVVSLAIVPLIIAGLAQPGFAVAIIKSSALRGAGDTLPPMAATMTGMGGRVLIVLIVMAILAPMGYAKCGLVVVWIAIFIDLNYRAIFVELAFRRGKWKLKKV